MFIFTCGGAMLTITLCISLGQYAEDTQELISLAETGNSQLLSSLDRFHCNFTTYFDGDLTTKEEAKYWKAGNMERCEIATIVSGKKKD